MPKVFSNVVQFATEGWSADQGRTYIRETEPGTEAEMVFEYFITTVQNAFSAAHTTRFCREAVVFPVSIYCPEYSAGVEKRMSPTGADFLKTGAGERSC